MQVETYETISLDEQQGEIINETVSEEALALIEALNLSGQRTLIERATDGDESTERRIPYRIMTVTEDRILAQLCPAHTDITKYKSEAIPLRVLQVAAHAAPLFKRLEVWHPVDVRIDDPVLVGIKTPDGQSWGEQSYILARWGRTLVSWEELEQQATVILTRRARAKLEQAAASINATLTALSSQVASHLSGGNVKWPNLNATYVGPVTHEYDAL